MDPVCCFEDLPGAMNNRDGERERERERESRDSLPLEWLNVDDDDDEWIYIRTSSCITCDKGKLSFKNLENNKKAFFVSLVMRFIPPPPSPPPPPPPPHHHHESGFLWLSRHPSLFPICFGWLVGFYGISTFVGYLMPNPFLCK